MPMDTFMQSQLDMYQEVSIDYGYGSLDPNKTLNYARNTIQEIIEEEKEGDEDYDRLNELVHG